MKSNMKLGMQLYHSGRFEQALNEFKSMEDATGCHPELGYFIGLCLTQLERYEEAIVYLGQVANSEFSFLHVFQSRMVLGYIYSVTERYKLAELEFKEVIEGGFESTQAYAALGFVLYCQNEVDDSVLYLKKALEVDPANANALNSLAYVLAEENIDLSHALKLCRKCVELAPDNPAYLDSLGWILYKSGKISEARTYLRKALDLSPRNKEIAFHMKKVIEKLSHDSS